jgi:hypothetical protein
VLPLLPPLSLSVLPLLRPWPRSLLEVRLTHFAAPSASPTFSTNPCGSYFICNMTRHFSGAR